MNSERARDYWLNKAFSRVQGLVLLLCVFCAALPYAQAIPTAEMSSEELLERAANSKQPEAVRQNSFLALVDRGATNYTAVLKTAQSDESDPGQRWVAIRILGKVGGPEAETVLVKLLRNPKVDTRTAAASALGDTGNQRFVTVLSIDSMTPLLFVLLRRSLWKLTQSKAFARQGSSSGTIINGRLGLSSLCFSAQSNCSQIPWYPASLSGDVDPSAGRAISALKPPLASRCPVDELRPKRLKPGRWLANQLQ